MKLRTNGGIEPLKVLQKTLQDWFKTTKTCVNSFLLYKINKDGKAVIDQHNQITSNLQFLKRNFNRIRPPTGTGNIWFTACIGYDEDEDKVRENTMWWYQENKAVMFKKALQILSMTRELWLLYSQEKIDLFVLKKAINDMASKKSLFTVPYVLVYTNIRKEKGCLTKKKGNNALFYVGKEFD